MTDQLPPNALETLLKLRKGAAASLNATRLGEIFAYMPGWKIEKTKLWKPSEGGWVIKEVPGGATYFRSFMKHDDDRIHLTTSILSPDVKGSDYYENSQRAEDERKIEVLKTFVVPQLNTLAETTRKKWNIRDVRVAQLAGSHHHVDIDVSFDFSVECSAFIITSPDGQTFEVFGDYKNGARDPKSFVDFFNWAVENTPFMETVLDILQMEAVEKKHDPRTPYVPPMAAPAAEKFIWAKLKDLTGRVRQEQKTSLVESITGDVEHFVHLRATDEAAADKFAVAQLPGLLYRVWDNKTKALVPTWKDEIDEVAESEVEAMQNMFVYKNTKKLASIIEAKGGSATVETKSVQINRGIITASLVISFSDGSSFRVVQSIVLSYVYNRFGRATYFYRFPTTFHDVVMPNGKPMGSPSEERMNTVFAKGAQ